MQAGDGGGAGLLSLHGEGLAGSPGDELQKYLALLEAAADGDPPLSDDLGAPPLRVGVEGDGVVYGAVVTEGEEGPLCEELPACGGVRKGSEVGDQGAVVFELDVVVDPDLGGTVPADGLDEEDITAVPVGVVDLVEAIFSREEKVLGVHNVVEQGVDRDVGGQVDDEDVDQLQGGRVDPVVVLQVELVVLVGVDYLHLRPLVLPEDAELLARDHRHVVDPVAAGVDEDVLEGDQVDLVVEGSHCRQPAPVHHHIVVAPLRHPRQVHAVPVVRYVEVVVPRQSQPV